MSEDLKNEVHAIDSIYSDDTLRTVGDGSYILKIPNCEATLRISFPLDYPTRRPEILGTESTGEHTRKGFGKHVVDTAQKALQKTFTPGSVCLFDLLQELETTLANDVASDETLPSSDETEGVNLATNDAPAVSPSLEEEPQWTLSSPITEKKSTFLARACSVTSPTEARAYIAHLLDTDKRAAKATHNITAYRIRPSSAANSTGKIVYQDCDDDGEAAAGGRLLHLLQVMDVWGVLVVVSRWYGGVKLGPDRFSIINKVAREALVQGGWTKARSKNH